LDTSKQDNTVVVIFHMHIYIWASILWFKKRPI
jgi:hypothetical protein